MPTPTTASSEHGSALIKPKLTAEQALTRLLELIRSSKSIQDFTPERLTEIFGQKLWTEGSDEYGYGEKITQEWSHGWQVYKVLGQGVRFDYSFSKNRPESSPPLTDICQMDFAQFSAELKAMGFSSEPYYVEHGRLMNYDFKRPGMSIEVYPEGERVWTEEAGSGRTCITMILIR